MTERHIYEGSGDATILTVNDFLQPVEPDSMREYVPFEIVTRYNFTSFIVRSFAESRGKLAFQSIFCQLAENHSGFQVRKTLLGLLHSTPDITLFLTEREQHSLYNAYDGFVDVPTHTLKIAQHLFPKYRKIHQKLDPDQFGAGLTEQLVTMCSYMSKKKFAFQFEESMSYKDFARRRDSMTLLSK